MIEDKNWFTEINENYGCLENYIKAQSDGGAVPLIYGYTPFYYLWEKNLLKKGDVVRTNLESCGIDGHYVLTEEGKLKGIEATAGIYSGKKGIHDPKERLNLKIADNGWSIDNFANFRISAKALEGKL